MENKLKEVVDATGLSYYRVASMADISTTSMYRYMKNGLPSDSKSWSPLKVLVAVSKTNDELIKNIKYVLGDDFNFGGELK